MFLFLGIMIHKWVWCTRICVHVYMCNSWITWSRYIFLEVSSHKTTIYHNSLLNHNQCKQKYIWNVPESLSTSSWRKDSLSFPSGPFRTAEVSAPESVSWSPTSCVLFSNGGILGVGTLTYVWKKYPTSINISLYLKGLIYISQTTGEIYKIFFVS